MLCVFAGAISFAMMIMAIQDGKAAWAAAWSFLMTLNWCVALFRWALEWIDR